MEAPPSPMSLELVEDEGDADIVVFRHSADQPTVMLPSLGGSVPSGSASVGGGGLLSRQNDGGLRQAVSHLDDSEGEFIEEDM